MSLADPDTRDWCSYVAAVVTYRSCFTTGVRHRIRAAEYERAWTSEELSLHNDLISMVDKHIAHSVNEMEMLGTTLTFATDADGKIHRGGLGSHGAGVGSFGPVGFQMMCDMIEKLVSVVVDAKIAELEVKLNAAVSAMSDAEILALPEGFPPHIETPDYRRRRKWPEKA